MAQIFPRSANQLPLVLAAAALLVPACAGLFVWYFLSPRFLEVGYRPVQPVPYSHRLHAGELQLDCRYCHASVETSPVANVPPTATCMNCHKTVARTSEALAPVRESAASGRPLRWLRVHKLPDYAYFNHSVHINRGVSCASCHGKINEMEVVRHDQPLSMGWCLDCHRNPENSLRPLDQITNLDYAPKDLDRAGFYKQLLEAGTPAGEIAEVILGEKPAVEVGGVEDLLAMAEKKFGASVTQREVGSQLKKHWQIQPPESCAACHR